jgi:tight adherence protein B
MMREFFVLGPLLLGLLVIVFVWKSMRARRLMQERLAAPASVETDEEVPLLTRPFLRRYRWVPWLAAAGCAALVYFAFGLHLIFAAALGAILGLLGSQLEGFLANRKTLLIETQLGEAIDLMVGALQAGGSVFSALEQALRESRAPLRPQLEDVLGRIRYGDDPQAALRALVARVPLEAFRLFAAALAVHWEVGGSLAPTLATVGRTIRDRTDVSRRIRSVSSEARVSVVAVLLVTVFIGVVMWRNDPDRMQKFLATTLGQAIVAAAAVLEAVGIVWSSIISRVKY